MTNKMTIHLLVYSASYHSKNRTVCETFDGHAGLPEVLLYLGNECVGLNRPPLLYSVQV